MSDTTQKPASVLKYVLVIATMNVHYDVRTVTTEKHSLNEQNSLQ